MRHAVQRVLGLCGTDPAAACATVAEVAAAVREALGPENSSTSDESPVPVRRAASGTTLLYAPHAASLAPQRRGAAGSASAGALDIATATAAAAPAAPPAAPTDAAPAINLNDVRSTVGGSDAVMMRLLSKFNGRAQATLDGMRRAVEQSDWTTLKRDAHSLKGASGYVAALALKAAAIALELSADESLQGPPVGTSPAEALANVEREMARVLVAIGEATGEPPASSASSSLSTATAGAASSATPAAAAAPAAATAPVAVAALGQTPAEVASRSAGGSSGGATADATPAINLNEVRTVVGGSDAVMMRLLTKFRERAHVTLDGMRRAVEQSDWMTLKRDAHSLKGSSGYVAALALKASAEALERSANKSLQGSGTSPAEALANVEREMARVLVAIGEATGEPPASSASSSLSTATAGAASSATPAAAAAPAAATAPVAVAALGQTPAEVASRSAGGSSGGATADATPAINLNEVRTVVGGSDAVMMRLLTKFRERAHVTLDGMRRAVEQSDWMTLKRDAHSLKGSSGYVAAIALKASAEALERSANESLQGPPVGTSPAEALSHVEEEMARVLIAIGEATGEAPPSVV